MWYNKRVLIAVSNIIGKHHKSIDKIVHMRPVLMCVCVRSYMSTYCTQCIQTPTKHTPSILDVTREYKVPKKSANKLKLKQNQQQHEKLPGTVLTQTRCASISIIQR